MIDLHSHLLPGVDDGPQSLAESVALAQAMANEGVRIEEFADEQVAKAIQANALYEGKYPLVSALSRPVIADAVAGVALDVRPGGEIALERLATLESPELLRFGLAGNRRYLLVEFPYTGWPLALGQQTFALRRRGIVPVLAHPERNPDVQKDPERLRAFVEEGAIVQLTAASLVGRLGQRTSRAAGELIDRGLAHMLASDAHSPGVRAAGLSAAAAMIGDEALVPWLTEAVPRAIVSDEPLPPRPERRRSFFGRTRRAFARGPARAPR
jgi:protein-tyrosine phosphatase